MPPDPGPPAGWGFGERLPTVSADRRDDPHDLSHLLDRQQPAERAPVSRLTPRFRPEGGASWRGGAWGGSEEGGREELAEVWPRRASSSRTRSCSTTFSACRAAF